MKNRLIQNKHMIIYKWNKWNQRIIIEKVRAMRHGSTKDSSNWDVYLHRTLRSAQHFRLYVVRTIFLANKRIKKWMKKRKGKERKEKCISNYQVSLHYSQDIPNICIKFVQIAKVAILMWEVYIFEEKIIWYNQRNYLKR